MQINIVSHDKCARQVPTSNLPSDNPDNSKHLFHPHTQVRYILEQEKLWGHLKASYICTLSRDLNPPK